MKRMFIAVLLMIAFSTAAFTRDFVASGKSYTPLGDYKIEKADNPFVIKGKEYKTYIITYENSPIEVTLVIMKGNDCQNYVVLSDKLSVQYVCNENYFGVKKLERSLNKQGFVTSDNTLNKTEYFRQKVITNGQNGEVFNAQLIASYFPMLIKDKEKSAANI